MRLSVIFAALTLLVLPLQASGAGGKRVEVWVAVPGVGVSNVTPAQTVEWINAVMGSPTDAPCIGGWNPYDQSTWGCTVEGWFRHELGQVFDYTVTVVPLPLLQTGGDACGQGASWDWTIYYLQQAHVGFSSAKGARTLIVVWGGGGWAGHFAPINNQVDHAGMVGDWGAMEHFDVRNSCVPDWDTPARGISHEFAGMMGEYITAHYDEGGLFVGDPMSAHEKADLLHYSGSWLRSP